MELNRRILIVDDNEAIHGDFKKVLAKPAQPDDGSLDSLEASILGETGSKRASSRMPDFRLDFAFQGQEALSLVEKADAEGSPYSVIFMDVRMPPGWDGVETTRRIWDKFPDIEVVICTAYSDYSLDQIAARIGISDRLLFLRKPYDPVVVQQLALTLTTKWDIGRQNRLYIGNLETLVAERTKQLQTTVESLKKANLDLEESMRKQAETLQMLMQASKMSALGEMAGGIAHEINNPLATLKIVAEQIESLLEDEPVDKGLLAERAGVIGTTVTRISKVITGMLSFSHSSGGAPIEVAQVSELIGNTLVFCQEKLRKSGVELRMGTVPSGLTLACRGNQISQVVLNLLNNANDAVAPLKDEKWIKVDVEEDSESVRICVSNSGPKIPAAIVEKIFQPFFTTKEVGKGTGLGLSISLRIAADHGGKLSLDPKCEQTRFVLRIPKSQPQVTPMRKAA